MVHTSFSQETSATPEHNVDDIVEPLVAAILREATENKENTYKWETLLRVQMAPPALIVDDMLAPFSLPVVSTGHYIVTYFGMLFMLPDKTQDDPYYLITRGSQIGVVAKQKGSLFVIGDSGASFSRIKSILQGWRLVKEAINNGVAAQI
ncbi:hypothetical protein SERLA73DRAFT_156760 [Serpula lacrymans var. lacrymans S7.3]|uniref:Uncharacterized protein n=2 Tax=Serpula lacrymans var. lacrymans TaxID=341189 RepID=F8QFX2_SERL3|nr:uncharacterized protein SERLADRAFT_412206 [Serpula lacrymans var. lacrymans S7.9]EGN92817.1 hypothetical protein SERLA73DRAFT_156760 [Serpula lacrymans var. lacrymans S7.3]EGO18491.1 hypothetical protein SERLADRAFT_412206 [Serpula lacrymans var. lacrymans S7.9]